MQAVFVFSRESFAILLKSAHFHDLLKVCNSSLSSCENREQASKSEKLLNVTPRGIISPLNTCLEFNTVGRSALWEVMVNVAVM